jgi:hypothetical protein
VLDKEIRSILSTQYLLDYGRLVETPIGAERLFSGPKRTLASFLAYSLSQGVQFFLAVDHDRDVLPEGGLTIFTDALHRERSSRVR